MANLKPLKSIGSQPQQQRRPQQGQAPQGDQQGQQSTQSGLWGPPPIASVADTGLSKLALADLVLKVLYLRGDMYGHAVADIVKLPFSGVLDSIMEFLKREKQIEITGGGGVGEASYHYAITGEGVKRALEAMERTHYAGPAPVTLEAYIESVDQQNKTKVSIKETDMRKVMENLIVDKAMLDQIGPAANSGTSIFLYGPPGNGKTTLSEAIGRVILGEDMWIPYAFDVDGQIVQVFDDVNHELSEDQTPLKYGIGSIADSRWIRIKRPIIIVGGELTMGGLDLTYNPVGKFYEAPYQVKANGGLFLIDDFGRQQMSPKELLNRWIVPLEKKYDFLTLTNGRKIQLPFRVLIVFSTNMDPAELVDDAFLRRIKYKIEVGNPTMEQFYDLFQLMCKIKNVPFSEGAFKYLIKEWYQKYNRDLRFVHPRDLLSVMQDIADYMDVEVTMNNKELIDRAAAAYFVEL
jgi:predicted ATPase with chaperone activity